jgi:D-arabinose 5-phosphate isomerase GutQ
VHPIHGELSREDRLTMTQPKDPRQILSLAQETILLESQVVQALIPQLGDNVAEAAKLMFNCRGHVLTAGAGTSNPIAARFAHLLSCCGTPALFIHPGDSQHGLSGAVTERDVLFAISKGGETTEVNYLARITKSRGAKLIGLTEKPESTLANMSDVVLCFKAPADSDPYGMIATGSSLFNAALTDALCIVLLKLRGYSKEQFAETHPGGAVGNQIAAEKAGG